MKMEIMSGDAAVLDRTILYRVYDWKAIAQRCEEVKDGEKKGLVFREMKAGQQQGFRTSFADRFGKRFRLSCVRLNPSSDTGWQFQILKK